MHFMPKLAALFACEKLGWDKICCGKDGKPLERAEIHEKVYDIFLKRMPEGFEK